MTEWTNELQVTAALAKRAPLPTPLATWPKAGELSNFPELMRERVRVTRAVGLNLTVPIDEGEIGAAAQLLADDPTLLLYVMMMPYHVPAPAVADAFDPRCDTALLYLRGQVERAALLLPRPPAVVLLNCERFRADDPISHAMTRVRLDEVYTALKGFWPQSLVHWFGHGAQGWGNRIDGWGPVARTVPLDALGDALGTGLYYRDRYLLAEIMARLDHQAHTPPRAVVPWLSFTHQKRLRIRDDAKELEYADGGPAELELCWEWGHELARGAGLFSTRHAAIPLVGVYPSAFTGADLRWGWWSGLHALLCGAEHVQIEEG